MNRPTALRRLLSYLWPLTRRVPSAVNGTLEVTLSHGRKVLDSRRANYSYGSLQRVLRYGLRQLDLRAVDSVLLLGLGGGSVVQSLRAEFGYRGLITAVELDPVVIRLAAEEFGVGADEQLRILCADAFAVLPELPGPFGLVIVDLFIDLDMPAGVRRPVFWQQLRRLLGPGGYLLFNAITPEELQVGGIPLLDYLAGLGIVAAEHPVEQLNRLVIGQLQQPAPVGSSAADG
jgi:SAM-dependent methyltransferase